MKSWGMHATDMDIVISRTKVPDDGKWQILPEARLGEMLKLSPSSSSVNGDVMCRKCPPWLSPHRRLWHKDCSHKRLLLSILAKPTSLGQLYAIVLPLCSTVYNRHAEVQECCSFPIGEPRPPSPSFSVCLYTYRFYTFSLLQSGQYWSHAGTQ